MDRWGGRLVLVLLVAVFPGSRGWPLAQQSDDATVIRGIDASVKARIDNLAAYTVFERYAVFRGHDEGRPVAEMLVKTDYRKNFGKTYTILSQSGSAIMRNEVLGNLLDNEKRMSQPGNVETALINSSNYEMKVEPGGPQRLDGRECLVVALTPRRNSPFLFKGELWVDAADYSIVQLNGIASKSPSFLTNPPEVFRQYTKIAGFPMATHAKAVTKSTLLGETIVKVDYQNYQIQVQPSGEGFAINPIANSYSRRRHCGVDSLRAANPYGAGLVRVSLLLSALY